MSYKALYRKWRPQTFKEIVGQEHITKTLKNAFKNQKIAHAYLLCGPRGTGKTSTAKIIAKSANCLEPIEGEPCNECKNCSLINANNFMDVVEIDGASNRGIDEIRELREKIMLTPAEGKYKVYIIDEVHMLTGEAFNALLKTLEEPPAHIIFIMATTEAHKIPATVLSRCQRFDFKRLSTEKIVGKMQEICETQNISYEIDALYTIARFAGGGMRDALSILDQCLSYYPDNLQLKNVENIIGIVDYAFLGEFIDAVLNKDTKDVLLKIDYVVSMGKDLAQFVMQILDYLRNLLLVKVLGKSDLLQVPQGQLEKLVEQAENITQTQLTELMDFLVDVEKETRWSPNSRVLLEIALVKYINSFDKDYDLLLKRISRLEKILEEKDFTPKTVQKPIPETPKEEIIKDTSEPIQIDFKIIKSKWEKFLEAVKKNKITTYAFLVEAKPLNFEEGILTIGFEEKHSFHMEKVQKKENMETIIDTFRDLFGASINVKVIVLGEKGESKEIKTSATREENGTDSLVEDAIKLFGGNVVEIID